MNHISLTGNLGKDAEMRYLQDGTAVLSFSVADSQGKDKPAIWWDCGLWGKRAEALHQYLVKGQQVTVFGTISEKEYTAKDGTPKKAFSVRVSDVALQGGKRDDGGTASHAASPAAKPTAAKPAATRTAPAPATVQDDLDDDIPF